MRSYNSHSSVDILNSIADEIDVTFMTLHLLALDFRHAPLSLREKVAFAEHTLPAALGALLARGAEEAAILSTCNRVELLTTWPTPARSDVGLLAFLSDWHGFPLLGLEHHFRYLVDEAAARHVIRVACGLESLVPGEMQILGQVKQAVRYAHEAGAAGGALRALFKCALRAGRRARRETGIARRPVSISHAAVVLIREHFGNDLTGRHVLLIG
ncbi:MAG: hypothetical protein ACRDIB_06545, partial [Ardenticatenaceae bacterium]